MNKYLKIACCAVLPVVWAAGCNDFLTGGELDHTPNDQTSATSDVLFSGIQANMWQYQTGDLARLFSLWMQSMAGVNRQFLLFGTYTISESDYDGEWVRAYRGGGLLDIKKLEAQNGGEGGDPLYLGIAQVYEAWLMGTHADIWGDIPYTQAADTTVELPQKDAQLDVYAHVQSVLDAAIANLESGQGNGPGSVDLVYDGDGAKWAALAHTLKARFYLHTAEVPDLAQAAYQNALAEAKLGIQSNDGDYKPLFTGSSGEENPWAQFVVDQRSGYIAAGKFLVDTLTALDDPRLTLYYQAGSGTDSIIGANPGQQGTGDMGTLSDVRLDNTFAQPIVTYNENLLIQAEAQFQTADEPGALTTLNTERALWGLPALSGLSGPALLNAIMMEKYIALFQNIEVFNDYKRTCIPDLDPAGTRTNLPGRLLYGTSSRQTNPANFPDPSAQPDRNANDPTACN